MGTAMGQSPEPNFSGRQLIRCLRTLREQAFLTQGEASKRMRFTLQKLSRLETGQLPGFHELQAMLDVYGLPISDWGFYIELWERAKQRDWWRKHGLKDPRYVRMEDAASIVYEFQIGYLPELLQTERYARTTFADDVVRTSTKAINGEVMVRMTRQQRLDSNPPLRLHSIVHEPVLSQGVDQAQCDHLSKRAQLPNVTFQILLQSHGVHQGLRGALTLLSFDDTKEPDIAFSENVLGWSDTQDYERTASVRRILDRLAEQALSPDESLAFLATLRDRATVPVAHHPQR
jgi:hypothetical protein